MISTPTERKLPSHLCSQKHTRILMLSFFTTGTNLGLWAGKSKSLGVKNRFCFAAHRDYKYVVEVVPDDLLGDIPPMFYKVFVVKHYLPLTDWLVWLDYDLIVKNPWNWYEQYLLEDFELIITDHKNDVNNGTCLTFPCPSCVVPLNNMTIQEDS